MQDTLRLDQGNNRERFLSDRSLCVMGMKFRKPEKVYGFKTKIL